MRHLSSMNVSPDGDCRGTKELDHVLETERSAWCGVNPGGSWWEVKTGDEEKERAESCGRPPVDISHALAVQHPPFLPSGAKKGILPEGPDSLSWLGYGL